MVRFKVNYGAHIARNFAYMDYDRMKYILHDHEAIVKEAAAEAAEAQASPKQTVKSITHSMTKSTAKLLDHHEHNVDFSRVFYEEVTRVDDCFVVHMNELDYVFVDIQRLAKEFEEKSKSMPKPQKKAQEAALKRNLTILHNKLARLETYRMLNRTAAIKILKKHDKLAKSLGEPKVLDSHMERVDKTSFGDGGKIRVMQAQLERLYADLFCSGIMEEAQGKLRLAKTLTNPKVVLAVTFKVGVICTLLAWLVNNLVSTPKIAILYMQMDDPAVYVYAAVAALIIYRWFWGFSVYMWDSVDIDYILILDLDANKHMPRSEQIFSDAATLTILYLVNVLIFHSMRWHYQYSHDKESVYSQNAISELFEHWSEHAYIMPVFLIVGTALLIVKSAVGSASCGVFSTKIFIQLFKAPFETVHLRHSYAADILCSFVKVFAAILYGTCYFTSGSYLYASDLSDSRGAARFSTCTNNDFLLFMKVMIYIYPYYIRLMQCLRQQRDHYVRKQKTAPISTLGTEPESQVETSRGHAFIDVDAIVDDTDAEFGIDSNVFIYTDVEGGGDVRDAGDPELDSSFSPMHSHKGVHVHHRSPPKQQKGAYEHLGTGEADLLDLYSHDENDIPHDSVVNTALNGSYNTNNNGINESANGKAKKNKPKKAHIRFMDSEIDCDAPSAHAVDHHFTDIPHVHVDEEHALDADEHHDEPPRFRISPSPLTTPTQSPLHALFGTAPDAESASLHNNNTTQAKKGGVSFAPPETYSTKKAGGNANTNKHSEEDIRKAIELVRSPLHSSPPAKAQDKSDYKHGTGSNGAASGSSGTKGIFLKPGTAPAAGKKRFSLSRSESFELIAPSVAVEMAKMLPNVVREFLSGVIVWPYSYNASRYFLSIMVIVFGAYPPQDPLSPQFMGWYYTLYVVSTLFNCYWDIFQDFQLLQFNCEHPWLRNKLFYEEQSYFYYIVLILNPILRFLWTLSFTPYGSHEFMILFEIIRRSLWACLRMEVGYIQELARRK